MAAIDSRGIEGSTDQSGRESTHAGLGGEDLTDFMLVEDGVGNGNFKSSERKGHGLLSNGHGIVTREHLPPIGILEDGVGGTPAGGECFEVTRIRMVEVRGPPITGDLGDIDNQPIGVVYQRN